jgi:hypothetical protein
MNELKNTKIVNHEGGVWNKAKGIRSTAFALRLQRAMQAWLCPFYFVAGKKAPLSFAQTVDSVRASANSPIDQIFHMA